MWGEKPQHLGLTHVAVIVPVLGVIILCRNTSLRATNLRHPDWARVQVETARFELAFPLMPSSDESKTTTFTECWAAGMRKTELRGKQTANRSVIKDFKSNCYSCRLTGLSGRMRRSTLSKMHGGVKIRDCFKHIFSQTAKYISGKKRSAIIFLIIVRGSDGQSAQ